MLPPASKTDIVPPEDPADPDGIIGVLRGLLGRWANVIQCQTNIHSVVNCYPFKKRFVVEILATWARYKLLAIFLNK